MIASSEKPLFIQLDIPSSPLLLSLPSDPDSILSAHDPPSPPCSAQSSAFPEMKLPVSSSSSSSLTFHPLHSAPAPDITITNPLSNDRLPISPPPRASPSTRSRLSVSASRKLVEFINFLEKVDLDMAAEIEHVKESIREAREYVGEWQEERSARRAELLKKREREKRETDSDFWFGI